MGVAPTLPLEVALEFDDPKRVPYGKEEAK
jgi:hypothetical protein